jgi:hypothetical protein
VGLELYLIKTDSNGELLWTKEIGTTENDVARAIVMTPDSGYALAGYTYPLVSGTDEEVYFVKLNSGLQGCCVERTGGAFRGFGGTAVSDGTSAAAGGTTGTGGTSDSGGSITILNSCITSVDPVSPLTTLIELMPNPVKGKLHITGLTSEATLLEVYTIYGAKVLSTELVFKDGNAELNVSSLESGIYLLHIHDKARTTRKFIVTN